MMLNLREKFFNGEICRFMYFSYWNQIKQNNLDLSLHFNILVVLNKLPCNACFISKPAYVTFPLLQWQPYGISCGENLIKECEEEAGIPQSISHK